MTQVSKKVTKQSKTGHSDMSQMSKKMRKQVDDSMPIMENKMDESRSWMGHKKSKTREHAR